MQCAKQNYLEVLQTGPNMHSCIALEQLQYHVLHSSSMHCKGTAQQPILTQLKSHLFLCLLIWTQLKSHLFLCLVILTQLKSHLFLCLLSLTQLKSHLYIHFDTVEITFISICLLMMTQLKSHSYPHFLILTVEIIFLSMVI